jgi:hypothetical protein
MAFFMQSLSSMSQTHEASTDGVTTMLVRWVHLRGHPQRARIRTSTLSRYVHDGSREGGGQYMGVDDAMIESSFYPLGREDALASPEAVTNSFR